VLQGRLVRLAHKALREQRDTLEKLGLPDPRGRQDLQDLRDLKGHLMNLGAYRHGDIEKGLQSKRTIWMPTSPAFLFVFP